MRLDDRLVNTLTVGLCLVSALLVAQVARKSLAAAPLRAYVQSSEMGGAATSGSNRFDTPTGALRLGPRDAAVKILVFFNYSCGHCADFERTLREIRRRYPQHIGVVMKHFLPTVVRSELAPQLAAECANEQGKFAEYNELYFAYIRRVSVARAWETTADSISQLNVPRFLECVRSRAYLGRVVEDTKEGIANDVTGTPTSFVNGVRVVGAVPFAVLNTVVARQLDRPTHALLAP